VVADDGSVLPVAGTFAGAPSLTVDGVIVPGGDLSQFVNNGDALYYLLEAYKHLKPITLLGDARQFSAVLQVGTQGEEGVVQADDAAAAAWTIFSDCCARTVLWSRMSKIASIPA
jgi:catalase